MTEKLKNIIQEEVMKLPKEGQEAINAFNWVKITEEVGNKFSFDEIELNNFQVETLLVLVGTTDPEFYATNIENQVSTTKDVAEKITDEVMQKIFTPINDIFLENIKKSGKVQNAKPEQNLDFILSGGDYSAFVEVPPRLVEEGVGGGNSPSPSQGEGL